MDTYGQQAGRPAHARLNRVRRSRRTTAGRDITPAHQQAMSTNAGARVSTVNAGHLSVVTRPDAVANVIETAVDATSRAGLQADQPAGNPSPHQLGRIRRRSSAPARPAMSGCASCRRASSTVNSPRARRSSTICAR